MGHNQASILSEHDDYDFVAVCDIVEDSAKAFSKEFGVRPYTDFAAMLDAEKPEVVAVPTGVTVRAQLVIQAAQAESVKGIYCEKPMAVTMADAKQMVSVCKENGVRLVVNHQRRIGADMVKAKELIDAGAIGALNVLRGHCAGDFLSDGTHVVDGLLHLAGDAEVDWVVAQAIRDIDALRAKWERLGREEPAEGFGFRYGHAVESGAAVVARLKSGLRLEIFTGDLHHEIRGYQDYVAEGSAGSIWRLRDQQKPDNLFICDGAGGDCVQHAEGERSLAPVAGPGGKGPWRKVEFGESNERGKNLIAEGYALLAHSLRTGEPHPMSGDVALNGFQIVYGVYESARLGKRVHAPLEGDRFPLDVMIEEGRA